MNGVTMIIATHNRTDLLSKSLLALFVDNNFRHPDQLIVVDDGGDDDCERMCESGARMYPIDYVYTDNPGETNCCHARNVGLRHAKYDEILVCEPEILFLTDVIDVFSQRRQRFPGEILHGYTHHQPNKGADLAACRVIDKPPYYYMLQRAWLEEIGGWDEGFPGPWAWDDIDLFSRLQRMGHDFECCEAAEAVHQWHPSRIEPAVENEQYFRSKKLPRDLVANQGIEWGTVK